MKQASITKEELTNIFLSQIDLLDNMPKSFANIEDNILYKETNRKVKLFLSLLEVDVVKSSYFDYLKNELTRNKKIITTLYNADQI